MALKILLTNDDGIGAEGMQVLLEFARKIGEVIIAAPKTEQSGKSHAIELHKAFEVLPVAMPGCAEAFSVDSTPADCVRYAILGLHRKFDLVISGVNRGLNIGRDIIYSGTVGAAFEAAALGVKALSVSTEPEHFDTARKQLEAVWQFMQERRLLERADIWNINIPCRFTGEIRITRQGGPYYSDDFPSAGENMVRPQGKSIYTYSGDFSLDTDAALNGHISLTPLTIDRTDLRAFADYAQK